MQRENINAVSVRYVASTLTALLAVAMLSVSGCASYPISKEVREQATLVPFGQVRADPEGTRGRVVIWGGRIINVVNEAHGSSIYIICLPSPKNEKPLATGPSPGRFIASSPDFLDPQMLPQGQLITIAGQLNGVRTELLGKMEYAYPVLNIKEMHIWPPESADNYPDTYPYYPSYGYYGPNWNWYWGWGWGPAWGWWWGYPYYPYYYGGYHGAYHGVGAVHGGVYYNGGYYGGSYHGTTGGGSGGGFHSSGGGSSSGGGGGGGGGGSFHGGGGGMGGGGGGGGGGGHH